ncbi:MAG: glutamate racemase [Clostridia bacterium]|nr:glutamate racemase [Clostridia bacterium]
MKKINMPIGFMDSGLGGLSVLREAIHLMPKEDFLYFGDSKNAPYGTKEKEEIKRLTFEAVDRLVKRGIKGLVVACNTASGACLKDLRKEYPDLPIVGIEPAIKPAVICNQGGEILVLATPMTLKQEKFKNLFDVYKEEAKMVLVPCKGLMEFVEEGILSGPKLDEYFEENIEPYINENVESIVLGCTHYPFLKPYLEEKLQGKGIRLIDGSLGTAAELKRRLKELDLLKEEGVQGDIEIQNSIETEEMIERSFALLEA